MLFFNDIQRTGNVSTGWVDGLLVMIYKNKGERTSVNYKIYTEILMKRLRKALDRAVGPQQTAFLPRHLIDDNVHTVQALVARPSRKTVPKTRRDWYSTPRSRKCLRPSSTRDYVLLYQEAKIRATMTGYTGEEILVLAVGKEIP